MTDEKMAEAVEILRNRFKEEMYKSIGGEAVLSTSDNEKFEVAYSIALYATLSHLATLVSIMMSQKVLMQGHDVKESAQEIDEAFHHFFHDVVDVGLAAFSDALEANRKMKMMN